MLKRIIADGVCEQQFLTELNARISQTDENITKGVQKIIDDVRISGDDAVIKYSKKFDNVNKIRRAQKQEILKAYQDTPKPLIDALKAAAENIRDFHSRQIQQGYAITDKKGIVLGQRVTPIQSVGIYVPGGTAAYPTSVLMNAIPASLAGVGRIVMVTPPGAGSVILAAAYICGIDEIYFIGGAQSVAALAYGTQTVPKVDKIVGPGNIYVATAKRLLFGTVDIDMIAGPSEILIIAQQGYANPEFIAADLLSQAEHDTLSSASLITDSAELADRVDAALLVQLKALERRDIAAKSLADFGAAIIVKDIAEAAAISDKIAPEHLEIMTENPFEYMDNIKNAGSVFLGQYSPEPLGDYYAGTNHVLPTSGTARFFSSLSVDSFIKKSGFTYYSRDALKAGADNIAIMADAEGLTAHRNSVLIRFKDDK